MVLSGDYRFDHTPIDGRITDVNALARLGDEGVLVLLADSTNAEVEGSTGSESQVGQAFHQIFAEAEGRVIMASFACHIHRIQQAITIAHLHGRKFAVAGRSMVKNVNIARNLGYLQVPEGRHDQADRDRRLSAPRSCSSSPPAARASHSRRSAAWPSTTIPRSRCARATRWSSPPSRCRATSSASWTPINRLLKGGATVIYGERSGVHVSGHAAREDLR